MTGYRVDAAACESIFVKTSDSCDSAEALHPTISADMDELIGLCAAGAEKLSGELARVYNRVLTASMTYAVQQGKNVISGGRTAVGAIQRGDTEMADRTEVDSHVVDEVRITDGKPV